MIELIIFSNVILFWGFFIILVKKWPAPKELTRIQIAMRCATAWAKVLNQAFLVLPVSEAHQAFRRWIPFLRGIGVNVTMTEKEFIKIRGQT
jgi:hypothetical protein